MASDARKSLFARTLRTLAKVLLGIFAPLAVASAWAQAAENWKTGVSLSGGEYNPGRDRKNIDYVLPTIRQIDYFRARGLRVFRIPVLSNRLFGADRSPSSDWRALVELIDHAERKDAQVIIDLHQYGLFNSRPVGRDADATSEFTAFWGEVAARLRDRPNVIFGLMNEPHEQSAADWLHAANGAIAAIRKSGARQLILVAGSNWSGAHSWTRTDNGAVMGAVIDPEDNFVFEPHQYLDANNSGSSPGVVRGAGETRLKAFTDWARSHRIKAFLGEFGFADTPEALAEGRALIDYMSHNRDVWVGWSYWTAGAWSTDYMFSIEPKAGSDRPQMEILKAYVGAAPPL